MTQDRATRALAKASKDLHHARAMAALAFSPAARRRHERRERVALARIADARRAIAFGCELV